MRKLLAAAAVSILAMSYVANPQVVSGAVGGTVDLAGSVFRALVGGVASNAPGGPGQASPGCVGTMVQGVCVPEGFEIVPPVTTPTTAAG